MTAQNCVHLHARVVVPKPEFSIVDQRKIALVNELRNFRTVTQCRYGQNDHPDTGFPVPIPLAEFRYRYAMLKSEQRYSLSEKLR